MFKNPFSFQGRIRRTEFCLSYIIYACVVFPLSIVQDLVKSSTATIFSFIILIPVFWFLLAQATKRCHDRGNSGLYVFIPFYIFWMLFADSDPGPNEYGLNPKGIGNYNSINEIGTKEY
ncbi:DUF805 domain-containing protein [Chryseobacterium sp. LAM-KRS1]|uniref:DUF805 domain-containing protein n=1 Tax=Chryseobacterium sp. LAM-KRS1 TaxID=2715754 RepID=UPI0015540D1F|nr:DUF805 domain-containing protein [Chryseobacterium sp. LAM-KRS1]